MVASNRLPPQEFAALSIFTLLRPIRTTVECSSHALASPTRRAETQKEHPKQETVPLTLLSPGQPHIWPGRPAFPDSAVVRGPLTTLRAAGDSL